MPLSMHIPKAQLEIILDGIKLIDQFLLPSNIKFPVNPSIKTNNGTIVPTNILSVPTAQQRELLISDAKQNPQNALLQALSNQVSKKVIDITKQDTMQILEKDIGD